MLCQVPPGSFEKLSAPAAGLFLDSKRFHAIRYFTQKLLAQPEFCCIVGSVTSKTMDPQADIALIGLAVMGQNLILNMNDHGFTVVAFNRTVEKVDHFLANEAKGTRVLGAH